LQTDSKVTVLRYPLFLLLLIIAIIIITTTTTIIIIVITTIFSADPQLALQRDKICKKSTL
jgi:hypothetical protein